MPQAANNPTMTATIHPTAIVDDGVTLGTNVTIGAYSIVRGQVTLGNNVELKSHVIIEGITTIGEGTIIHPFAVIGAPTPDRKYKGEASELIIGKNNVIREYVTMHPGTADDKMKTVVGDNNLILERVHIAHDCIIGNNVTIVNSVGLSGHVIVEDNVTIGGMTGITQFVRIGTGAFIGAYCKVEKDVLPFSIVRGEDAYLNGVNIIGLKRRNIDDAQTKELLNAHSYVFSGPGTMKERVAEIAVKHGNNPLVIQLVDFINSREKGGLTQPKQSVAASTAE